MTAVCDSETIIEPQLGALAVGKLVTPDGTTGTFTFTITGPNGYNNTVNITFPGGQNPVTLNALQPGPYTVTETTPAGDWVTQVACDSNPIQPGTQATSTVPAGGQGGCIFINDLIENELCQDVGFRDPVFGHAGANAEDGGFWNTPIHRNAQCINAGINPGGGAYNIADDTNALIMTPGVPNMNIYGYTTSNENPNSPLTDPFGFVYGSIFNGQGPQMHCIWAAAPGNQFGNPVEFIGALPIPQGFECLGDPTVVGDNLSASIMGADCQTIYPSQPFTKCPQNNYAATHEITQSGSLWGDLQIGSHGGAGIGNPGGTIRVGEWVPGGSIDHVIGISLFDRYYYCNPTPPGATPGVNPGDGGFRWPAVKSDEGSGCFTGRYQGTIPDMTMGSLLKLPKDCNIDALETEAMKILARTLRDWGAIVNDSQTYEVAMLNMEKSAIQQGNNIIYADALDDFTQDWGYPLVSNGFGTPPDTAHNRDWGLILSKLEVVTNNFPDTPGGGPINEMDIETRCACPIPLGPIPANPCDLFN